MALYDSEVQAADEEFAKRLSQAREGCPVAVGELLQACQRFLLSSANRSLESTLRPKKGASDLVQETFVIAHQEFAAFRGESLAEFSAWLNTILERRLHNHWRAFRGTLRRRVNREIPVEEAERFLDHSAPLPQPAEFKEEFARVSAALDRLPPAYREVIELRAWQGLKFREIAERMDKSTKAVEKLWSRAIEKLEEQLRGA